MVYGSWNNFLLHPVVPWHPISFKTQMIMQSVSIYISVCVRIPWLHQSMHFWLTYFQGAWKTEEKSAEVISSFFTLLSVAGVLPLLHPQQPGWDHQSVVIVTTNRGQLPQSWYVPSDGLDIWDTWYLNGQSDSHIKIPDLLRANETPPVQKLWRGPQLRPRMSSQ